MPTIPEACPKCGGSGILIVPLGRPMNAHKIFLWRIREGVGYVEVPCGLCLTRGTCVAPEPLPSLDPSQWPHRVPEEARTG